MDIDINRFDISANKFGNPEIYRTLDINTVSILRLVCKRFRDNVQNYLVNLTVSKHEHILIDFNGILRRYTGVRKTSINGEFLRLFPNLRRIIGLAINWKPSLYDLPLYIEANYRCQTTEVIKEVRSTNYGCTGATGSTGPQGMIGPRGIQGIPIIRGPTGSTGFQGVTGIQGPTGSIGWSRSVEYNSCLNLNINPGYIMLPFDHTLVERFAQHLLNGDPRSNIGVYVPSMDGKIYPPSELALRLPADERQTFLDNYKEQYPELGYRIYSFKDGLLENYDKILNIAGEQRLSSLLKDIDTSSLKFDNELIGMDVFIPPNGCKHITSRHGMTFIIGYLFRHDSLKGKILHISPVGYDKDKLKMFVEGVGSIVTDEPIVCSHCALMLSIKCSESM